MILYKTINYFFTSNHRLSPPCIFPIQFAVHLYDLLMKTGADYSIRPAGFNALRWLRTEKCYAYWGIDFNSHNTPFEIGREMRVNFDKVSLIFMRYVLETCFVYTKTSFPLFHYLLN